MSLRKKLLHTGLYGVGLALLGFLTVMPICNMVFACGCRNWWNGAAANCHYVPGMAGVHHPCPWCDTSEWLLWALLGAALVVGTATALLAQRRWNTVVGWLAGSVALLGFIIVEGVVQGVILGYPRGIPGLFAG